MKLYKILNSVDPEVIGFVDQQMETYVGEYDYWGNNSFTKIPLGGRIIFDLKFPVFKLYSSAKRTDLLQNTYSMGRTLLVSPNAREVLEQYNNDTTQWYSAKILHNHHQLEYFVLYMPNDRQSEFIDWEASSFSIVHRNEYNFDRGVMSYKEIAPLTLSNYEEYILKARALREAPQKVHANKVILASHIEYDLFRMNVPLMGYFCSSRLKMAIEKAGLTGFRFEPVDNYAN